MIVISQHLVDWASQECAWQYSGELSVGRLVRAVDHAYEMYETGGRPTDRMIQVLGLIVEPKVNTSGYRDVNVVVGDHNPPDWQEVPRLMINLVTLGVELDATEYFREFEKIHPFRDGNGRVGAILFNWINGTLNGHLIEFPPNLFGDDRRDGVDLTSSVKLL